MPTIPETLAKRNRPSPMQSRSPIVLRCLVWRSSPDGYFAECVDLDLAVRADTPDRAFQKLSDAMAGYLKVAFEGDAHGLVPRPAPPSHRLRYHLYCLRAVVSRGRRDFRLVECSPECLKPSYS